MPLTLYSMPSSGNSYKARLLLAFLDRRYTHVGLEYETPELENAHARGTLPLGKLPVLVTEDGGSLPESNAILWYLAQGTSWLPARPIDQARVLAWLFWEQNRHEGVIAVRAALRTYKSRAHLATPERMKELLVTGHAILETMNSHLANRNWFEGSTPSIADIALYAYTHSAGDKGGFDMAAFPHVGAWCARFATLPGYVDLDDIPR